MPNAPRRIQRRRAKGWRMPKGAVYVGRPTMWGNRWVIHVRNLKHKKPPSGFPQRTASLAALKRGYYAVTETPATPTNLVHIKMTNGGNVSLPDGRPGDVCYVLNAGETAVKVFSTGTAGHSSAEIARLRLEISELKAENARLRSQIDEQSAMLKTSPETGSIVECRGKGLPWGDFGYDSRYHNR